MKRLVEGIKSMIRGLVMAASRFPLTVACLVGAAGLLCYMISLHKQPELIIQKLMFTFLLGAFLGIAAQFGWEKFARPGRWRLLVYGVSILLTVGYYLILLPASSISIEVTIRTFVAVFAMFCAFLWVPSYRGRANFNGICLTHFKSAFISILYSGVLSAGIAAIIAAINLLLFQVHTDSYGYMMTIIWVLFAPIYYLSLLPRFNSEDADDREYVRHSEKYPKFLEILVSYIAIPLLIAYTLVLVAYFIKILVTWHWPSGQLGGMVLAYSAAGFIVYVLASQLENRFAFWYRLVFPKVIIPVVIMQIISVAIRLNAYGVTESRYYIALFGIFSITCGVALSFLPVSKNGIIALLAAAFAVFSVIPPVDAFTVSRNSQISRLENMLIAEGVLKDGKLSPKADVSMKVRTETTNILSYLENRDYIEHIKWLPPNFISSGNMKKTFGFEPAYGGQMNNFYANLDTQKLFNISGYDVCVNTYVSRGPGAQQPSFDFEVQGVKYRLTFDRLSDQEVRVAVQDTAGGELIATGLYDFTKSLEGGIGNVPKEALPPEKMTFDVERNGYKLRVMFQYVNITYSTGSDADVDYGLFVMFGAPD